MRPGWFAPPVVLPAVSERGKTYIACRHWQKKYMDEHLESTALARDFCMLRRFANGVDRLEQRLQR